MNVHPYFWSKAASSADSDGLNRVRVRKLAEKERIEEQIWGDMRLGRTTGAKGQ
jgi:hypothetical protein